jgi:hypothetical protein
MALMAAHGEIGPMPDCAIFADTQSEPAAVYQHLDWLCSPNVLPFSVHRVTAGSLEDQLLHATKKNGRPPAFVHNPDGSGGMLNRQCTGDFKIDPIRKKVRELIGLKPKQRAPKNICVEQWIGISTDEAARMKPSNYPYITHRFPLIEGRMSRNDCLRWIERRNYPTPPKSACVFCPFHSDAMWRALRDNDADGWRRAIAVDHALRNSLDTGTAYLHRSRVPLDQVDLSTAEDRGQLNMFNNECEGMCGV